MISLIQFLQEYANLYEEKIFGISKKDHVKELLNAGWEHVGGGSHDKYQHKFSKEHIAVPRHPVVSPGIVRDNRKKMQKAEQNQKLNVIQ